MPRSRRSRNRGWGGFAPYVPVSRRRAQAEALARRLSREGRELSPVSSGGRSVSTTFWGLAWCANLESYGDFENRLPRGRTYLRNGSVIDLQVSTGCVTALVSGSEVYNVRVEVAPLSAAVWTKVRKACVGGIGSLVELLAGRLSDGVLAVLTQKGAGLFPAPREIRMACSCPDHAVVCKHVAATLYGVAVRFDERPELFFTLRAVDQADLVEDALEGPALLRGESADPADPVRSEALDSSDLSALFGIDLEPDVAAEPATAAATIEPTVRAKKPRHTAQREPGSRAGARKAADRRRAAPAAARPPTVLIASELRDLGVPPSTVQGWLRSGVLEPSGVRGVYLATPRTQARLRAYLESRGLA